MKVLMINVVCGIRSTGRICTDLATEMEAQGHEVKIAYGRGNVPERFQKYAVKIGSDLDVKFHGVKARFFDDAGFGSKSVTEKFIKWVKNYNPDVIHLHNIHGYYINVEVLFKYLKTCGKKVVWTLHDCWSFTGHCVYFDYVGCNKWKTCCSRCLQKYEYPKRIGPDMSRQHFFKKKQLFTGIKDMTLVTPSKWLADLVSESYLSEYDVRVIHNGVDTEVFKPTVNDIGKKYDCENKKIILGVASVWDKRKGLNVFVDLSRRLSDSYQIILVGLSKKQIKQLPQNIIGIECTNDVIELIKFYSAATVFINPTSEDNYPTTNLEAIACGTPVITFNTGGSPEGSSIYGLTIEKNNIEQLIEAINYVNLAKRTDVDIDYRNTVQKYIELYEEISS